MTEYSRLIDEYLDDSADESAIAQLKAWLNADPANLEIFAREVFVHQQLREALVADNSAWFMEAANNPAAIDAAGGDTPTSDPIADDTAREMASFPRDLGSGMTGWM